MLHQFTTCLFLSLALSVGTAGAQSVLTSVVSEGPVSYSERSMLVPLRAAFARGDMATLRSQATEDIALLSQAAPLKTHCCTAADHVELVFPARDRAGALVLVRVLVDNRPGDDPDLPGLKGSTRPFWQVFVAEPGLRLSTVITSTRVDNPLVTQAGAFATAVLKGIALPSSLAAVPPPPTPAGAPPAYTGTLFVSLQKAELPDARAKLVIRDSVIVESPLTVIVQRGRQIVERIAATSADACVKTLAEKEQEAVVKTAALPICQPSNLALTGCLEGLKKATAEAYAAYPPAGTPACSQPDAARSVGLDFQELTAAEPKNITSETTVNNRPTERLSFGLATTFIAKSYQKDARVKLQNGTIVVDPLTRTLAMAVVNWHVLGYRAGLPSPSLGERLRVYGGIAFAPYVGPTAGVAFGLTRNLGVTAGGGWLAIDRTKGTDQVGAAPTDKVTPFRVGVAPVVFAGATFGFPAN
ncbi:MAG: hypothetical protein U0Q55_21245 [Vicinamibacterales bacterium]